MHDIYSEKRNSPRIFICHAREDSDIAIAQHNKLKDYGYSPWIDKIHILPGQDWDLSIRNAIDQSEFMIIILSKNSTIKRGYVQKEFKLAVDYVKQIPEGEIYLIPVKIDDCEVPKQFASYQYIDLKRDEDLYQIKRAVDFQMTTSRTKACNEGKL